MTNVPTDWTSILDLELDEGCSSDEDDGDDGRDGNNNDGDGEKEAEFVGGEHMKKKKKNETRRRP